ncbi:MAG: hypothetical protein FWF71_01100 [Actinomycetia bacterium]|nr:hypothetical protein [Actinomycetes bacterium]
MKLITEDIVKKIIKDGDAVSDGVLQLSADCMLTPAAKAVVIDCKLKLNQDVGPGSGSLTVSAAGMAVPDAAISALGGSGGQQPIGKRYHLESGGVLDEKPEHMTQLTGNLLVAKDDLRIRLRGEIDLLIAEVLKIQVRAAALACDQLVDDLEDIHRYVAALSRSEVLGELFAQDTVIGLDYQAVREVSHHPQRHFGRGHLFDISYRDGELPVLLNALRAASRHCEVSFYAAFKQPDGRTSRPDLMEGFNRLSSLLYILCLRAVSGQYGEMR